MVIITQKCSYTEKKIYPGHGQILFRRDGRKVFLIDAKSKGLYKQGIKPAVLTWTMAWRRLARKVAAPATAKRRKGGKGRKGGKAFTGISVAELAEKRNMSADVRKAKRDNFKQARKVRVQKVKAIKK
ncbi:MAG: hypothetical protein MHM6MM_002056 [Cercozoa sp. M6MM]